MSRSYTGARRKRTNTPADNRKRAVAYRHRRIARPSVLPTEETAEICDVLTESPVFEEKETEEATEEKQIDSSVSGDLSVTAETVVPAAATAGFLSKIAGTFKGLFSSRKNKDSEHSEGIVDNLKTWINSPIDPDEETESEETTETVPVTEETVPADEMISDSAEAVESAVEPELTETSEKEPEVITADEETEYTAEETSETTDEAESVDGNTELTEATEAEAAENTEEETVKAESVEEKALDAEPEEPADESESAEEASVNEDTSEELSEESAETESVEEEPVLTEAVEAEPGETVTEEETEGVAEKSAEETAETESVEEESELTETSETESEEASPEEETEEKAEELSEVTAEEPEQTEEEPELSKKEKRQLKKEIRKETKIQLLDEIIDSPKAGLILMAIAPGLAMKRVSSVEKTTLSVPSVLILNILKWGAVGTFFALFFEKFVNLFNYSFIRMNFSATSALAFRFGIFGLVCEYVSYILFGLVCGLARKKISTLKLMEVESRSAFSIALLFIIACVLVYKDMMGYGVMVAACAAVIGFITKGYGLDLTLSVSKTTQLICVAVIVAAAVYAGYQYFPLTVSGLMDIFKAILNI